MMVARGWICLALLLLGLVGGMQARAQGAGPFDKYFGRWVGEGRLGMREGATELVKCRVTYTRGASAQAMRQSIRCAAASGNIDVQSEISHADGALTGTWKEQVYDLSGDITGNTSERGLRLRVRSQNFSANMSVSLREERQVIEIHFLNSTLIGLTLSLTRG